MNKSLGLVLINLSLSFSLWAQPGGKELVYKNAQDVLNARCVTCHACNSSPCQLDLASPEGIMRGASKLSVYDGERVLPMKPSRLFIDASTPKEWHDKFEFQSVTAKDEKKSFLYQLINLGRKEYGKSVLKHYKYVPAESRSCPLDTDDRAGFIEDNKNLGMPFGFPPLNDSEDQILTTWTKNGSEVFGLNNEQQLLEALPKPVKANIGKWEEFLNERSMKVRITARYLYEHWYLAHLYFPEQPQYFFRIVRSKTKAPKAIEEIATVRPYDDPKHKEFYYRLRPVKATIVHKDHILYELGNKRLNRMKELFIDKKWDFEPKEFPSYKPELASNPFVTFEAIPPSSRYQLFLDNTQYFSMTFIRGPVCEGQVAVNVIDDHFYVFFLDPSRDLSIQDKNYLEKSKDMLSLPAAGESNAIESYYGIYKDHQEKYLQFRAKAYEASKFKKFDLRSIWDGEQGKYNAMLTILRHFDNAAVLEGAIGGTPQTVWIMDYPIFERMYYLLVAGFNVFGNLFHQLSTRLYMDNLRVESENNFLYLFPHKDRIALRKSWYKGEEAREKMKEDNPFYSKYYEAGFVVPEKLKSNPALLLQTVTNNILNNMRKEKAITQIDKLNCCLDMTMGSAKGSIEEDLKRLARIHGRAATGFPEYTLLLIEERVKDKIYGISRVSAHKSVSFLFDEAERREPELDKLIVADGVIGSYPNFFMRFNARTLKAFVDDAAKSKGIEESAKILTKHGLLRLNPSFWQMFDDTHKTFRLADPKSYGILDMSKYVNF